MVAELKVQEYLNIFCCSLAKISMVAEPMKILSEVRGGCSLAKISMVAEPQAMKCITQSSCSLAKISMVAEPVLLQLLH